ncbi:hypothetical protein [Stratiformator vulcanicus]|uniref:KOW domain-containing protein n=1 Tax=Stratiformator vulcanicus TaxID=2527980 RepID=A0A517QZZ9_9PLAN|nr:hypothetical protein [Stratiformator vulcanicus]QDT37188.1 hypothetical protein Pan189_15600 [Stratiformator vulcanicus]
MSVAYTPGLRVDARTRLRLRRLLPLKGEVLVAVGDHVEAMTVVARTSMPGDVIPINVSNALSIPAAEVPSVMLVSIDDHVNEGDVVAHSDGLFGLFPSTYRSKTDGVVESISEVTGQVILRGKPRAVEVKAFLAGEVIAIEPEEGAEIEAEVSLVQGIFGIGGEAFGEIATATSSPDDDLTAKRIEPQHQGKVVVGGRRMTIDAIRKAIEIGVSALIAGGIDDADLKELLGYDLGVAVTGSEQLGTTLIITEGFGEIAMARQTFELLQNCEGRNAAVDGTTQIRAGVIRPQIVIPIGAADQEEVPTGLASAGGLQPGAAVRIIRDPYFGILGVVDTLPHEPAVLDSGSKARVVIVRTDEGTTLTVPRANVELMSSD